MKLKIFADDGKMHWWALKLTVLCIIFFIFQLSFAQFTADFALISADLLFRPWILITHIFLHGGIPHLLYNMFALALFGSILEKIIGQRKFLLLFFISGIIAGIGSALFYSASLGASGAIFGLLGCLTVLRPKMLVWALGVPMPMFVAAIFWALGDLLGLFSASTGVANAAHLAGMAFGIAVGLYLWKTYGQPLFRKKEPDEISEQDIENWEREHIR